MAAKDKHGFGDHKPTVIRPDQDEFDNGRYPPYARLVLTLPNYTRTRMEECEHYLDEAMSWDIRDALAKGTNSGGGKSIVEQLEIEMDRVVKEIMEQGAEGPDPAAYLTDGIWQTEEFQEDVKVWGEQRGQAQGLAFAISTLRSIPVPSVRSAAMMRWERADNPPPRPLREG